MLMPEDILHAITTQFFPFTCHLTSSVGSAPCVISCHMSSYMTKYYGWCGWLGQTNIGLSPRKTQHWHILTYVCWSTNIFILSDLFWLKPWSFPKPNQAIWCSHWSKQQLFHSSKLCLDKEVNRIMTTNNIQSLILVHCIASKTHEMSVVLNNTKKAWKCFWNCTCYLYTIPWNQVSTSRIGLWSFAAVIPVSPVLPVVRWGYYWVI